VSTPLHPASYSPLLLQAQITVPPAGEMGLADTTRLENPFQGPMWLDEIRFRLAAESTLSWSSLSCKLKLGDLPLTQGNVPVSLLGKALNDNADGSSAASSGGGVLAFTWKLPKPLFIPARELLRPTLYFAPYSGATEKVVTVCYACRPLPVGTPTPKVLQVPWVASYMPPMQQAGVASADRVDESQPSDLYNPWDQDLHVQRFVGRLMVQNRREEAGLMGLASITPNLQAQLATNSTGTLVSAQDSQNNILIRDPTPFAHVFDFVDRAWTVNCLLPPKGFYQFTVERLWSQYGVTSVTATVGISMVGWREVPYL
jgi:hypothetical protein